MQIKPELHLVFYEDLTGTGIEKDFDSTLDIVKHDIFGLELDCDAIALFPSSAVSPSGFSLNEVRNMVRKVAESKNCQYFHLCEAIPSASYPTGKALALLVSDFLIKKNELTCC